MENNQFVARYNYKDKSFYILLSKNNKIIYSYLDENNKPRFDLNEDELSLAKDIFSSLLVDEKSSYYVRDEKGQTKTYKIFFDSKSKNYYWKSIEGEINVEDNVYFNMKYNHIPDIVYCQNTFDKNTENNREYRKEFFDKKRQKIISVLVSATIFLSILTSCDINTQSEVSNVETSTEQEFEQIYNWEEIKSAIQENPNLTDEEKSFLYKLKFVFDENHKYMDLEEIVYKLKDLSIIYINHFDEDNPYRVGSYNRIKNTLTCYNATSFKDVYIDVFLHEFFHVLQPYAKDKIHELSNELFTREVLERLDSTGEIDEFNNTGGNGYSSYMGFYYYLAELIPQEVLKEFQFGRSWDEILVDALCQSVNKPEPDSYERNLAYWLIESINSCVRDSNNYDEYETKHINEMINYFYQLKGKNAAFYFLNNSNGYKYVKLSSTEGKFLLEKMDKMDYLDYTDFCNLGVYVQNKTYFSDTYPETILTWSFQAFGRDDITKMNNAFNKNGDDFYERYTATLNQQFELNYTEYLTMLNPRLQATCFST